MEMKVLQVSLYQAVSFVCGSGFLLWQTTIINAFINRGFLSYGKTTTANNTTSANADEGALGLPLPSSLGC